MNELIQKTDNRATIRWKLLTSASALALAAYVSSAEIAMAEDAGHPQIWIELDSQFARQQASDETFLPPFLLSSQFDGASQVGRIPGSMWDNGAKISFQPSGSDWILSAAIRYGKVSRHSSQHQLTAQSSAKYNFNAYQNFNALNQESHTIVDFQVGRDVGLGKFGSGGSSVLSTGLRFAQFKSRSNFSVQSQPTNSVFTYYRFYASFDAQRKFEGVGPSLSWDASATIAGNTDDSRISLDWGVNGALLFGRQSTQSHHQSSKFDLPYHAYISSHVVFHPHELIYRHSEPSARSRNVTVPDLGGFAGVSWRSANAKVSFGYRADMFFGAIDGGIDARKSENRGFYGPFASISVGVGD
jgi:hypothetical protein